MNTIKGTLITMQDGEKIFVSFSKDQINKAIDEALSVRRNYITITELNRDIYFNYIKDKKEKTLYIRLEEPKKEFIEIIPEKRKIMADKLREIAGITFDDRKKKFLERRLELIKQLSKEEEYFELETTISKLEEYKKYKLKDKLTSLTK